MIKMRTNSKYFVEGQDSDFQVPLPKPAKPSKKIDLKAVLKDCKSIIGQLQNQNKKILRQLQQKSIIIDKLLEQKQTFMIHMANCDSHSLMKAVQEAHLKEVQISQKFNQMDQKYQAILQKKKAEIQKLKSYNRALRIDNENLREQTQTGLKSRKVGSITNSERKDSHQVNSFSFTKINQNHIEEELSEKYTVVPYQTPEKTFQTSKSTALPSTGSTKLRPTSSAALSSQKKIIPQNLFSNQYIRQFRTEGLDETGKECFEEKKVEVAKIMRRIREVLAPSDDDSY